jgi:hypothetical protein
LAQGRLAEGGWLARQALDVYRAALGEEHPEFARGLNLLASIALAKGKRTRRKPKPVLDTGRVVEFLGAGRCPRLLALEQVVEFLDLDPSTLVSSSNRVAPRSLAMPM